MRRAVLPPALATGPPRLHVNPPVSLSLRRCLPHRPLRSSIACGRRLPNPQHERLRGVKMSLTAYAGLAPVPWQSGGIDRDQGIAKAGNPRLRKTMMQVAWLWIRHQPGSAISQWFARRVGTARGRVRRIAIVAVARKLLVALWRYVTQGVIPEGAVLKA